MSFNPMLQNVQMEIFHEIIIDIVPKIRIINGTRDAGRGLHDGGTDPCPLKGGVTGAQVALRNRIIGNFRDAGER